MDCREIQETLSSLMTEILPTELASHVDQCSACSQAHRDFLRLRKLLIHYDHTLEEEWGRVSMPYDWALVWLGLGIFFLLGIVLLNYLVWQLLQYLG